MSYPANRQFFLAFASASFYTIYILTTELQFLLMICIKNKHVLCIYWFDLVPCGLNKRGKKRMRSSGSAFEFGMELATNHKGVLLQLHNLYQPTIW